MNQSEFEALLADPLKSIGSDITWSADVDHSPSVEFRAEVSNSLGHPLFVRGSYNALAATLTYALIHRTVGRIYGLDLGKDHHNPSCNLVGEKHKHRWDDRVRDKNAYVPNDITARVDDPVSVWKQFCEEARITHSGTMTEPPARQLELF
jgi:hypothetical protein